MDCQVRRMARAYSPTPVGWTSKSVESENVKLWLGDGLGSPSYKCPSYKGMVGATDLEVHRTSVHRTKAWWVRRTWKSIVQVSIVQRHGGCDGLGSPSYECPSYGLEALSSKTLAAREPGIPGAVALGRDCRLDQNDS